MTDQTEAPERYWIWRNEPNGELVVSSRGEPYPADATEVVPLDVVQAMVAAARSEAFRTGYNEGFLDGGSNYGTGEPDLEGAWQDYAAEAEREKGDMTDETATPDEDRETGWTPGDRVEAEQKRREALLNQALNLHKNITKNARDR